MFTEGTGDYRQHIPLRSADGQVLSVYSVLLCS